MGYLPSFPCLFYLYLFYRSPLPTYPPLFSTSFWATITWLTGRWELQFTTSATPRGSRCYLVGQTCEGPDEQQLRFHALPFPHLLYSRPACFVRGMGSATKELLKLHHRKKGNRCVERPHATSARKGQRTQTQDGKSPLCFEALAETRYQGNSDGRQLQYRIQRRGLQWWAWCHRQGGGGK